MARKCEYISGGDRKDGANLTSARMSLRSISETSEMNSPLQGGGSEKSRAPDRVPERLPTESGQVGAGETLHYVQGKQVLGWTKRK